MDKSSATARLWEARSLRILLSGMPPAILWLLLLVPGAVGQPHDVFPDPGAEALVPMLPEGARLPGSLLLQPLPEGPQEATRRDPDQRLDSVESLLPTLGQGFEKLDGPPGPIREPALLGAPVVQGAIYDYPEQLLQGDWLEIKRSCAQAPLPQLRSCLNRMYEARLDTGFSNSPGYALLLVRLAFRLLEAGDFIKARAVGETACNLAPAYYPAPALMAGLALKGRDKGVFSFLNWNWLSWKRKLHSFSWQVGFAGSLILTLLVSLYAFSFFLGFYFVVRYGGVLLHALRERTRPGSRGTLQIFGLAAMGLAACLVLPGPFWLPVSAGLLLTPYARRWEKLLFAGFLLFWACSPWVLGLGARFLVPPPPATQALFSCIQGDWDARADHSLRAALEQHPDGPDLLLTAAVVAKRRGDLDRALGILAGAVERFPGSGALWNNLGNVQAILGRTEKAKDAYLKSVAADRKLASPRYNLSLLLRREFSFIEGSREFEVARTLDAQRVDSFAYTHTRQLNRFFMDEDPPLSSCWRSLFKRNSEAEAAASRLWEVGGIGMPLGWAPLIFGPLAALVVFRTVKGNGSEPFRCNGCGVIACGACQPGTRSAGLCNPCYQTLYERNHIVRERRNLQIRRMAISQARRSRRLIILNLLLPGAGTSVQEERVTGMMCLLVFVFGLVALFWWPRLPFSPGIPWETAATLHDWRLALLLLAAYLGFQAYSIRKLLSSKG